MKNPETMFLDNIEDKNIKCLREHVLNAIDSYFKNIGVPVEGEPNSLVIDEVEAAMYEGIMRYTRGNQSKAAKILGVSRGTLRTKLMHYFSTTHVGGIYRV